MPFFRESIVSTLDLDTFEDRWSSSTGGNSDCINLGFGHLRGHSHVSALINSDCINLDTFEDLRPHQGRGR